MLKYKPVEFACLFPCIWVSLPLCLVLPFFQTIFSLYGWVFGFYDKPRLLIVPWCVFGWDIFIYNVLKFIFCFFPNLVDIIVCAVRICEASAKSFHFPFPLLFNCIISTVILYMFFPFCLFGITLDLIKTYSWNEHLFWNKF